MKISKFQFSNPNLLDVVFHVNEEFNEKNYKMEINTSVDVERETEKNEAFVTVTLSLGNKKNAPFFISITEQALFKWGKPDDPIVDEANESLKKLLKQNAPALLIGYIRPMIAFITSNSPYPSYHLPFVDFTED